MIYLTTEQLAKRWGVSTATLVRWRADKKGPPYHRIGDAIRYRLDTIEAFEKNRQVTHEED